MKRFITTKQERAAKYLSKCNPESVQYVREFKEEIDNLTVLESDGYNWIEVDPSEEIQAIEFRYIRFGIDEDLIDDAEELELIYEAICETTFQEGLKDEKMDTCCKTAYLMDI